MKIGIEDLAEIEEILKEAESFRPIVQLVVKTIRLFSDDLKEIPEAIYSWAIEKRIASIQKYEDAGFSREDAISMTLDDSAAIRRVLGDWNKNLNAQKRTK